MPRQAQRATPGPGRAAARRADRRGTRPFELTVPDRQRGELHVSVRTLSRAFASTAEPVGAYIRRRRLEETRQELTAGHAVSEVAARRQFVDSGHFVRAFRQRYGQTPAQHFRNLGRRDPAPAGAGDGSPRSRTGSVRRQVSTCRLAVSSHRVIALVSAVRARSRSQMCAGSVS
ncbi:helix-turn-helix transcriptional regulator [Streptomyces mirabilis]|uniref:helix-turn-helix transcriptional regulator n=1 Tax=Streptomyces mirabilis TaxID=68239 RepID=UPI00332BD4C3